MESLDKLRISNVEQALLDQYEKEHQAFNESFDRKCEEAKTNGGNISVEYDYEEYRRLETLRIMATHVSMKKSLINRDWEEFSRLVLLNEFLMPEAFGKYFKFVPENMKAELAVNCYTCHGDKYPQVRNAVKSLVKNGVNELPAELAKASFITVYRAGEETKKSAKNRISWTLSLDVAKWFMEKYRYKHAKHIFKAKIRPEDVIAYCDDRKEQEILQYGSVFDVEEVA